MSILDGFVGLLIQRCIHLAGVDISSPTLTGAKRTKLHQVQHQFATLGHLIVTPSLDVLTPHYGRAFNDV